MKKIVFTTIVVLLSTSVFANRPLMSESVNAEKYIDSLIKDNVVKAEDRTYYVCQTKALLKAGDDLVKEIEKSPENVKPMNPEKIMKHCEKHKHN